MKHTQMEEYMYNHAKRVMCSFEAPSFSEREESELNKSIKIKKMILLIAILVCIISITAIAAMRLMAPEKVADALGDAALSKAFSENSMASQSAVDGDYCVTLLGIVTGENLSDFQSAYFDILPERTYAVVAVAHVDGTPMTQEEPLMITPLIQGLTPWRYNIASMHGGYSEKIIEGVLYRIIEMDSIACFFDQKIYLAVIDSAFINNEHFLMEEETGKIIAKEDYEGTNILFELSVDAQKADAEKASQYLIKLQEEWEE